ncbi:AAA family ATPase [Gordonia amarae]|uniref:DNA 3'-5' helicase n=2 Tax=Gordonia amarae TaxID=36821 RepID=G7GSZ7_9ACTN|nr:ATP-dependent DNA helicase [Gordonia amarae]MCS3880152.1 superfamily I DNA/RNA helicase/RecB family exonuclease [Gordonia amarae]QHN18518.1 AAA family ATPase [Gordonia amarae]QHN23001.1 AAA family ATPase [Gordonia amarae]QHN31902.1 AAA family ATPase [Gordonia amarae]QHN40649.1 AAA family ATPase [Gordonia amarae]
MSRRPEPRNQPVRGTALRARLVAAHGSAGTEREWPSQVRTVIGDVQRPPDARAWRPYRVHGGPGTGKTALVVDAAVARLSTPGVDPESVLVVAPSRRASIALREEITRRVLARTDGFGGALREPLVRTVHSYAFAILRLQAAAHGNPPPRLITGSEQDVVLRELLAGDIEDGAEYWPAHLRPALGTDGFAQALRDLLMRAAERGAGPEELIALGREHTRPEWVAAGHAYAQYEQTMLLRGSVGLSTPGASAPAVDAAELVGSALSAFATDPDLLTAQRRRIRHLIVDDAQHLDPQAAYLLRLVGTGTASTIITADTDQSVFGFRGASPVFADGLAESGSDHDIVLTENLRSAPEVNRVGALLARRLPGARPHPYPEPSGAGAPRRDETPDDTTSLPGSATVRVFSSTAKEATAVADLLRRAHLFEGVPWSRMAVIVRSVSLSLPALRRAFRSAGVPMVTQTSDLPLHRQRAVLGLMLALRAIAAREDHQAQTRPSNPEIFGIDHTVDLVTGVIGGADPGAMRRLRRGIRRYDEAHLAEVAPEGDVPDSLVSLRAAILDDEVAERYAKVLSDTELAPLNRVRKAIGAGYKAHTAGLGLEHSLWAAWQATGHDRRWAATALRGGPIGEQADRDLDAVIAMFEAAGTFTDNLPAAGPAAFVHYLTQLQIPRDSRTPHVAAESVAVISAHAAVGREWDVVAVAGVADGLWPSLRSRGSVLATGPLIDLLDGVHPDAVDTVARGSVALADERRLLLVACTRARRTLMLSAVDDGDTSSPSRFLLEIADALGASTVAGEVPVPTDGDLAEDHVPSADLPLDPGVDRVLSLPSLVAALRSALVAGTAGGGPEGGGPEGRRTEGAEPDAVRRADAAATLLAELADADVPGAHPRDWYGLAGPSTDVALWSPDGGPVVLSPSTTETLSLCSLRWLLERHGGRDGDQAPAVTGTLVHTLVQATAGKIDPAEVTAALREVWDRVDTGAAWFSRRELERAEAMLVNFREWLRVSRSDLTEFGVEADINAVLPPERSAEEAGDRDDPAVRLRGRIDRLELDHQGRPVVIDVKTGKTPISKADAQDHAQLATYQVALRLGGIPGAAGTVGGDKSAGSETGGGRLVYVSKDNRTTGAAERVQDAPDAEVMDEWITLIRKAARASVGPRYAATPNPGCPHCPVATSCPAHLEGRTVLDD